MQGRHSNKDQAVRSDRLMNAFEKTAVVLNMFHNIKQPNRLRTFRPNDLGRPHALDYVLDSTFSGVQHALCTRFNKYGRGTGILKSLSHTSISTTDVEEDRASREVLHQ